MNAYPKSKQTGKKAVKSSGRPDDAPESVLQNQAENWLRWNRLEFWRMPDHLARYLQTTAPIQYRKIHSEYFLGKPDLTILFPDGRYLNIEFKSKSGRMSTGQERFARNIDVYEIRSFESFVKLVESKLNEKRGNKECSVTLETNQLNQMNPEF